MKPSEKRLAGHTRRDNQSRAVVQGGPLVSRAQIRDNCVRESGEMEHDAIRMQSIYQ